MRGPRRDWLAWLLVIRRRGSRTSGRTVGGKASVEHGTSGPLWLTIAITAVSFVGVLITAVVGPIVVDRRRVRLGTAESPEPTVIARRANEAVTLIQSEITDLQFRVGRLEALQMAGAHGQR